MSQKLHLDAGLLWIHGLHAEALHLHDLYLLVGSLHLLLEEGLGEREGGLLLVDEFRLIFLELTLDDLLHQIDRYVHIAALLLGTDDVPLYRNGNFNFLTALLHAQGDVGLRVLVKIALQLSDLLLNGIL